MATCKASRRGHADWSASGAACACDRQRLTGDSCNAGLRTRQKEPMGYSFLRPTPPNQCGGSSGLHAMCISPALNPCMLYSVLQTPFCRLPQNPRKLGASRPSSCLPAHPMTEQSLMRSDQRLAAQSFLVALPPPDCRSFAVQRLAGSLALTFHRPARLSGITATRMVEIATA